MRIGICETIWPILHPIVLRFLFFYCSKTHFLSFNSFLGEAVELRYTLSSYGVDTDTIPISWTGNVKVNQKGRISCLLAILIPLSLVPQSWLWFILSAMMTDGFIVNFISGGISKAMDANSAVP